MPEIIIMSPGTRRYSAARAASPRASDATSWGTVNGGNPCTNASTLIPLAVVAGLVSLVGLRPGLVEDLPESAGWLLSLPQVAFSYLLCTEVAALVQDPLARRFRGLRWAFVVVGVGPVLLYGGGVDVLLVPLALTAVAAGIYLVWLLFRASTEVHGPRVHLRKPEPGDGPPGS